MLHSHQEVEVLLSRRWDEIRREQASLKESIDKWDARLKDIKKLCVNAPRESEQEITLEIENLERQHATTSQTKAQERNLLYEIEKLKQKKKAAANYSKFSVELNQLKDNLTDARSLLLEKEAALDELTTGLRKIRVAARAGVNSADLIEATLSINEDKIPLIVGKGGITLRSIEEDFAVSIEIDHLHHKVRIMGLPKSVQQAQNAIQVAADTATEDFSISYATQVVLSMNKSAKLLDLQQQFDVIIDNNVSKSTCKITGPSQRVDAAKRFILGLNTGRTEMRVDKSLLPSIIGKGGSVVRSIAAEHNVDINVSKDDETVEVTGMKPDVVLAVKAIQDMIENNREVEEIIHVPKHILLGCLLSDLRTIQKEHSVRIDADGAKEDKMQSIKIKGMNFKVKSARSHLENIIDAYKQNTVDLELDDEVVPAVLGKGGVGIKAMRERYPDAHVDVDGAVVHIHCISPSTRQQIIDEIQAIVGENFVSSMDCTEDFAIMLKTSRAAEIRDSIARELNVRMNIEKSNTVIKLKGTSANVGRTLELLNALKKMYIVESYQVIDEDYPVLLRSGDESLIRIVSERYQVDITANRKDLTLLVRGNPVNVRNAIQHIAGFLNGNENFGSIVIPLDDSVSANFIGKGGSNVKKLEEELGVKFDILKSRGLLRIHGPNDKVGPAKVAVFSHLLNSRVHEIIELPSVLTKDKIDDLSRRLQDIFNADVEVQDNNKKFVLRSSYQTFADAKKYIADQVAGHATIVLPLLEHQVSALNALPNFGLARFHSKFSVKVGSASVELSGELHKVENAKRDFLRAVHSLFPLETAFIELSRACLRDIVTASLILSLEKFGARVSCDRIQGFLWLVCPSKFIQQAQVVVESVYSPWKALNSSVKIDEFMVPIIVGKGGSSISLLRKELQCSIDVDRTAGCMYVKATTEELLANALQILQDKVDKIRSEHFETKINPRLAPVFIGKNGSNINKFKADTGVNIDVDSENGTIRLNGPADKILDAKTSLLNFIASEEQYISLPRSFTLSSAAIPVIIGTSGATIKDLQEKSGARIDIDRDSKRCSLRGKNQECEAAFNLINALLEQEGHRRVPRLDEPVESDEEEIQSGDEAKDNVKVQKPPMSKSAMKRLRRKERDAADQQIENKEVVAAPESTHSSAVEYESTRKEPEQEVVPEPKLVHVIEPVAVVQSIRDPVVAYSEKAQSINSQHLVDFLLGKEPLATPLSKVLDQHTTHQQLSMPSIIQPQRNVETPLLTKQAPPGLSTHSATRLTTSAPSIGYTSYRNSGLNVFAEKLPSKN